MLRTIFGFIYIGIPHGIVLGILGIGSAFITLISFFQILFTGKMSKGNFEYQVKYQRYNLRVNARLLNLCDGYPAFGLNGKDDKTVVELDYPEKSNRGSVLLRTFFGFIYVMIPHGLVLMFVGIGVMFATLVAWFSILFTGKYPENMHKFVVNYQRWVARLNFYMAYLTDQYPPFNGEPDEPVNFDGDNKSTEDHLVSN